MDQPTKPATMEADPTKAYNDATGFIRLNGL